MTEASLVGQESKGFCQGWHWNPGWYAVFGKKLEHGNGHIDSCHIVEKVSQEGEVSLFHSFFIASMPPAETEPGLSCIVFGYGCNGWVGTGGCFSSGPCHL